jgi:cysteinyl-tRNA synthetase
MEWNSPWSAAGGKGFPGWHIECSAMSRKYLGDTFDIHCGGIDHIPIHHTNEIAQSEACTGKKFVNYWMHGAFLEEESGKMSKSKGEFLRLQTLIDNGYSPIDYRYLCLGTHYRKRMLFSWEILEQSKASRTRLMNIVRELEEKSKTETSPNKYFEAKREQPEFYIEQFLSAINDDLNMPEAIAVTWKVLRDENISAEEKLRLVYVFDKVLGLSLDTSGEKSGEDIPEEIKTLASQRIEARKEKNFTLADELRDRIKILGYEIIDKKSGTEIKKI